MKAISSHQLNFNIKHRMKIFINLIALSLFLIQHNSTIAQSKPDIDKIDDAVVIVKIFDFQGQFVGHGSGFIIDSIGTVVTNYHVVKDAYFMKVSIERSGNKADYEVKEILEGDEVKDLAKISINNPAKIVFPYLRMAKKYPSKGDDCWAIGTPADPMYMNTVSKGIISNIEMSSTPIMLQTNAEFTHGSSGGALINSSGEVIGVTHSGDNSEDGARASINFAIWIGELSNLAKIQKKTLIDPKSVPSQISFYTKNPNIGIVYLYVDNYFVGSFKQFFQDNAIPNCGDDGTITRYLYSGKHNYQVYYAHSREWYSGSITIKPGECEIFCINGPTNQSDNENSNSISYALGITMAETLRKSGIYNYDQDLVIKAFADHLAGLGAMDVATADKIYKEEVRKMAEQKSLAVKKAGEEFLAANKNKKGVLVTSTGLQYLTTQEGTGVKPDANDKVTVHYTGTLIDGTVFDSSVQRGTPATFGLNQVIPGWTEGLQLMKEGGKTTFYIPSELAYGSRNQAKIPANSVLIFEVELIKVEPVEGTVAPPAPGKK
jgi:FKBP-type peptidyl-prolyl cis-trans isomerase/S1-C subfamily serine protease